MRSRAHPAVAAAAAALVAAATLLADGRPGAAAAGAAPLTAAQVAALRAAWRRPDNIPFPADNPYTPEKATLGKMLYFDPRVSGMQNMSCASCHNPSFGWEVPLAGAIGSQNTPLARNAPTILDHAWSASLFWDGRAPTLEAQATGPIESPAEMNMALGGLVERLRGIPGYVSMLDSVFPGEGVTADSIARGIATYERTVVSSEAPIDRWMVGDDNALSASALRGLALFQGEARCTACHTGWRFSDGLFHDIGLPDDDLGRAKVAPGEPGAEHAFKTPSLRDVALRQPFMHDGSLPDLRSVITHYVSGGVDRPSRSALLRPVRLGPEEQADLLAFLESLTGEVSSTPLPILPR